MNGLVELALVALAGAIGALIRWLMPRVVDLWRGQRETATVIANSLGSALAGAALASPWGVWSWLIAMALAGSITTLSTLAVDVAGLLRKARRRALLLLFWHVVGGAVGFGVGFLGAGALG